MGDEVGQSKAYDVFLSYSNKDDKLMEQVKSQLTKEKLVVWNDKEHITPGFLWPKAIEKGIHDSRLVVVILTPNTREAEGVRRELEYARLHSIFVIPLLLSGEEAEVIFFEIAGKQYVDARQELQKLNEGIQKLIKHIRIIVSDATPSKIPELPVLREVAPSTTTTTPPATSLPPVAVSPLKPASGSTILPVSGSTIPPPGGTIQKAHRLISLPAFILAVLVAVLLLAFAALLSGGGGQATETPTDVLIPTRDLTILGATWKARGTEIAQTASASVPIATPTPTLTRDTLATLTAQSSLTDHVKTATTLASMATPTPTPTPTRDTLATLTAQSSLTDQAKTAAALTATRTP